MCIGYIQWLLIYTYICTIFSFTMCKASHAQEIVPGTKNMC